MAYLYKQLHVSTDCAKCDYMYYHMKTKRYPNQYNYIQFSPNKTHTHSYPKHITKR